MLVKGENTVELTEGGIVRERVYPVYDSVGYYEINWKDQSSSYTKHKTGTISDVYKNGKIDKKWIIQTSQFANGNQRAIILVADYDPTAIYTVDYIPLEPYKVSAYANPITIEYRDSLGGAIGEIVEDLAGLESNVRGTESVLGETLLKFGDFSSLTTVEKSNIVKAINEVNSKPSGEGWKLIQTITLGNLGDQWFSSWINNFLSYSKLKFVLKGLTLHHQMSGTQAAVMLQLEVPNTFTYKTYGHRFMEMAGTVQSLANTSGRNAIPLLSANIPSSTTYPHPEISGELIIERKDFGAGFMTKSLGVESWFMARNGANNTDQMYEWQKFDLVMGVNHVHSEQIGLSNNRPTGFTKGIIEIWGVPNA
jgi:hypothetical protein